MNENEIKNYATDLNELWKSGQLLEYARFISELYEEQDTSVTLDVLEHLKFLQED